VNLIIGDNLDKQTEANMNVVHNILNGSDELTSKTGVYTELAIAA